MGTRGKRYVIHFSKIDGKAVYAWLFFDGKKYSAKECDSKVAKQLHLQEAESFAKQFRKMGMVCEILEHH